MGEEKRVKCRECNGKLTQNEVSDNIYAGNTEAEYICYKCQSEDIEDENVDESDDVDSILHRLGFDSAND